MGIAKLGEHCDIMRFMVLLNRHHKVSQSVPLFMQHKTVTILLRIRAREHFVVSNTKYHESHCGSDIIRRRPETERALDLRTRRRKTSTSFVRQTNRVASTITQYINDEEDVLMIIDDLEVQNSPL